MNASQPSKPLGDNVTPLEPVVNEHECSRISGRGVGSLRRDRLMNRGIPFVKLGALVRYRPCDIRQFLENNLRGGDGRKHG